MNQTWAKIKKSLGNQMYQAELLRPDGKGHYVWLRSFFVNEGEKILAPGRMKNQAWEIHLTNVHEFKRNVGIMKLNSETGDPISLNHGETVTYPPKVLHRMMGVEHVAGAVQSAKRGNTNLVMVLMAFGMGLLLGAMIMQGLPAIAEMINPPRNQTFVRPIVEMLSYVKP